MDPSAKEKQDVQEGLRYFKLALYVIIFIAGIILNILMFLAVTRKRVRHRRTAKSFIRLMQNLAMADILFIFLVIPFDSAWWSPADFPYGGAECKYLWPLQNASFEAIVLTYVMLSFHRTYGVKQALFGQMNDIFIMFLLFMIWIGGLLTVVPFVVFLNYDATRLSCDEMWPLLDDRRAYSGVLFLLQYLLPLMVLLTMYFVARHELNNAIGKDRSLQKRAARHRRVNTMLITYIIVFAILILPQQIIRFVLDFGQGNMRPYFFDVMKLLYFLTLSITVTNPILFFYFNGEFRSDLTYFVQCLYCRQHGADAKDAKSDSFSIELPPPGEVRVPYTTVPSRQQTLERYPETASVGRHSGSQGSKDVGPRSTSKERLSYHGSRDPVIPRDEKLSHHSSRDSRPPSRSSRQEFEPPRRSSSRDLPPDEPYYSREKIDTYRPPSRERLPQDPPYRTPSREQIPRDEPYRSPSREYLPRDEPYRTPSREHIPRDEPYRSRSQDRLPRDEPYRSSRERIPQDPPYRTPSREHIPRDEPYRSRSQERLPRDEPYRSSRERIPQDPPYRSSSRERLPPDEPPYYPGSKEPYRTSSREDISRDPPYRAPSREDFPPRADNTELDDDQGSEML